QVPLAEVRRDDLEITAAVDLVLLPRRRAPTESSTTTTGNAAIQQAATGDARILTTVSCRSAPSNTRTFPLRDRESLQRALPRRLFRAIEIQDAGLRAGIEFHLQRLIVLPGNADSSWLPDDAADAIRLALIAAGVVGIEVPAGRDFPAFTVDGDA